MNEAQRHSLALPVDSVILNGRYRLQQLLHRRPRVNLYLGQRLSSKTHALRAHAEPESLVAIRELVLTGLPSRLRVQIEQATFEEFLSPLASGSQRLSREGERTFTYGDRHYLVAPLQSARAGLQYQVITLAELLLSQREWPAWLDTQTALSWGIQLSRIVARLHRLGNVLADLDPTTILVDRTGAAGWVPVLLPAWPPAPHFWSGLPASMARTQFVRHIFAAGILPAGNPFGAPEAVAGIFDERADVYTLGAILYLLLTHYAPPSARLRQGGTGRGWPASAGFSSSTDLEQIELIPPRLFNTSISPLLEGILFRALALEPAQRHPTAFSLAEALEASDLQQGDTRGGARRRISHAGKALGWLSGACTALIHATDQTRSLQSRPAHSSQ
jgi:hypothetical protein